MKRISIFLYTIICVLLLSGCGKQQNETISSGENNVTPPVSNSTVDTSIESDAVPNTITNEDTTTNGTQVSDGSTENEATVSNETVTPSNPTSNETITVDEAKANALSHAGLTSEQATFTESKLDYDDGRQVYELEFYSDNREYEYDYEIDAYTGEVVSYDCEVDCYDLPLPSSTGIAADISADAAKEIALAKVPGAAASDIKEFKTDYDDGRTEYEGKIIYNRVEYEFEIDTNGNILSWEEEPLHSTMQPK